MAGAPDRFRGLDGSGGKAVIYYKVSSSLYAAAGVPEYWLCDLTARAIEVHREPAADGYRRLETRRTGESVAPGAFPDLLLSVDDLPPAPR